MQRRPRFLRIVATALAVAVVAVVGISVFVGWQLSHWPKKALDGDPSDLGLRYEDVEFLSAEDDVLLRGWFLPGRSDPAAGEATVLEGPAEEPIEGTVEGVADELATTIVIVHGFRGNRLESGVPALELAASLVDAGMNVLMFDFRNSGESDGTVTTLGFHEVKDILGAVAWLKAERPEASHSVGLVGYSMGAVTSALAAAREPEVGAVVLDSPFADLAPYLRENMPVWTGLPNVPFTWTIMALLPPLIGLDMDVVSPLQVMPEIVQDVLLIHTDGDDAIPVSNSEQLAAAGHPDRTELWVVPGPKHIGARSVDPEAYDRRVIEFFQRAL